MSEAEVDSTGGTQALVFSDLSCSFGLDRDILRSDHCDLLLDAMDKQLDQLQQIHSHKRSSRFRENVCKETVTSGWSQSVSKDTGLGSTQTDTPLSCQDLQSSADHMSESSTGFKDDPGDRVACVRNRDRDRAAQESHQEEALWRLHRLLGDSCEDGDTGTLQPLSDSICTEDFARRFSQEMVHESVTHKRHGTFTGGTKDLSKANLAGTQKTGAGLRCRSPRTHTEDGHNALKTLPPHVKRPQISTSTPKPKCVAGVPVLSFDSVSIDSDLDSVCTERLRQHIHKQPGWRSFMESVRNLDELWKGHQGDDTDTLQDTELLTHTENQHTTPHLREESTRPLVDEEKDLEEESKRSSPGILSGCPALRERLCSLQNKCQEEDTLLNAKRSQLSEVEHSLTELQQKKQEALREIAQLRADTVRLEQERKSVECSLQQTKAEKESVRHDLQMVQRQRESAHHTAYRALDLSDKKCDVVVMSVLERDELQRQLTSAKFDLFTEQRRARERLEALQERLDEAHEELQKATDAESALRDKCDSLEEQHRQSSHTLHALESQVCELQGALEGSQLTVATLEKILCEKELQLQELHKLHREEQSHREQSQSQLQQLKTQHYTALREAREHAHSTLQTTLQQHKKDLELRHQREIHKLKEEEAKKCKEELEVEVLKKVQTAVEEEHSRREAEREEAVRAQSRLEQQHRDTEKHLTSKIQQEKNKARTLHSKLREMHVEQQRAAVQLKQAEAELSRLRRSLEEREKAHTQCTAEGQLRASHWALELLTEVSQLQGLLQNNSSKTGFQHNPSPTVEEALSVLRSVREQVQSFIKKIQEELLSLKSSTEKMHSEKERELSVQRQQLRREWDHVLDALKERLIQEHVEELSSLQREGPSQEVLACLRSQLRAKDSELKQVQRSMVQWKEHTAHRMACKFEEELNAELERCKAKVLRSRHVLKAPDQLKGPVIPKEEQSSEEKACPLSSVCSVLDCSSDTASLKLLLHLQTRVKQLCTDNQNYSATHSLRDHTAPLHCCTEETPRDKHQCN